MPVAIVGGAFLFVHQDVVGFAELLEFLFRVRVVRIFIGMKFDRELAIGALDLIAGRVAFDAQDFVVIALGSSHLEKGIGYRLTSDENVLAARRIYSSLALSCPLETTTLEGRRSRSLSR